MLYSGENNEINFSKIQKAFSVLTVEITENEIFDKKAIVKEENDVIAASFCELTVKSTMKPSTLSEIFTKTGAGVNGAELI